MIQIIGLMMGTYIFTRLLEMATTPSVNVVVRVIAALAILVEIFLMIALMANQSMTPGMPR